MIADGRGDLLALFYFGFSSQVYIIQFSCLPHCDQTLSFPVGVGTAKGWRAARDGSRSYIQSEPAVFPYLQPWAQMCFLTPNVLNFTKEMYFFPRMLLTLPGELAEASRN